MPADSPELRQALLACVPSLILDAVAKSSGQRVVYFGHFDDKLIPTDLPAGSKFLRGWEAWGTIVVKVVSGIDTNSLTYLQREIELLREIKSPYFPKLLFSEVFTDNPVTEEKLADRLFLTIEEHVKSEPLSNVKGNYGTQQAVAALLLKMCIALRVLWDHRKRLVHRDLKPDNILIRPDGEVAIIDLGIVRETGAAGNTNTAHPWGPMTPAYASPEQVLNDKYSISFKSDFFALGIIAHELITGQNPFCPLATTPPHDVMYNVQHLAQPSLESLGLASTEFSILVGQLLQKEPFRRPRTPDQLIAALTEFVEAK